MTATSADTTSSDAIEVAATFLADHARTPPQVGLILGTGLGELAGEIDVDAELPYELIPGFPSSTAPSHRGALLLGRLAGVPIAAMAGRLHCYEGYSPAQVAFPVRVMAALGASSLVVSNACGGMNPAYRGGDLMIVSDHVNLTFGNPLLGLKDSKHLDMSAPYDAALIDAALTIARRRDFVAHRGVYVGVLGPNYETRAEYRCFRRLGGDAVGMSTIHEVLAARREGLRVLAISVVTNECRPEALGHATSALVENVAAAAQPKVRAIIAGILPMLARIA